MSNYQLSINNYQLPKGYKQTEVGVIPEDWEVKVIGDIADVKTGPFGSALHESDYVADGTPIITVEHLGDLGVEHINLPMVSDEDRSRLRAYSLKEGDIVFSRVGSIDRNALIKKLENGWLFSGRLLRVRINSPKDYPHYLSYHFYSEPFKQRVREVAVGQTMPSLNTQLLKGVQVVLPTSEEQRAIAQTLSDVDALLASLDKLIAKQRHLKTATMQQLLTGKKRLPGFSEGKSYKQTEVGVIPEDWDVATLGSFADKVGSGITPTGGSRVYKDSGRPFIRSQNVGWGFLQLEDLAHIDEETHQSFAASEIRVGDVLLNITGASIGRSCLADERIAAGNVNQHVCIIRTDQNHLISSFLGLVILSEDGQRQIDSFQAGGNREGLNFGQIRSFQIRIPQTVEEQRAIATVLSDMDAAISALETRRTKTQAIKQGMMQQLLTGRTRLV